MGEMKSFLACLLLVSPVLLRCTAVAKETEVRALVGTNVLLPCRVDTNQCGTLHSVKWYKEASRIYVFSQAGQIRRGEGDASERMNVTYNEAKNETLLQISPVKVDDEATYKCEITYLEVGENCDVVQIVKLTTLVKPTEVVLTYNGKEVNESTSLEEKNEGDEVVLTCKAPGGKPIPTVSWYNGTHLMNRASYSARSDGGDGTGTGISKLQLTLTRGDLNARFECKVESQALDEPITRGVTVPVKVSPTKIELFGVNGHVTQGTIVSLFCQVYGARPIAEVAWYNQSDVPLKSNATTGVEIRTTYEGAADGTFTTKSTLSFSATRFENGNRFDCFSKNEVIDKKKEPRLHALMYLYVRYPPVITVGAIGSTMVHEGDEIILSCKYFSNPQKLEGATWVKDGKNVTKIPGKHKNGNTKVPSLTITGITREDMGEYACLLQNEVNSSLSEDIIFLDVHYPPDVEIIMLPSTPANATQQSNVTLFCNITSGNPPALRKVRWFLDGELMAELPECNYSFPVINDTLGGPFCGIDPSILSLVKVEESFAGNYTCLGENDAGVGPMSEPKELVVYYPPSAAKLTHYPPTVIKKGQVVLTCSVDDPGFPTDITYLWFRNGHLVHNITEPNWTIRQASLETRSNFSCIALNKGGQSRPAFDFVNVEAPPALITKDNKPYKGVLYSSQNVSLTCRIECFPLCSIKWFKNEREIDFERDPLYYVNNTIHPADNKTSDFESIESILVWNMTNWPDHQLDKRANNSHYTCASFDPPDRHRVGVNFATEIAVHYPPENLTVTHSVVNVIEDETPVDVKCSGDGRPNLSFVWKRNLTGAPIMRSDTLKLPKMSRSSAGKYYCEAFNPVGNKTIDVEFNVWYKPECTIERAEVDNSPALICRADGNPREMSFFWTMIEQNKTLDLMPSGGRTNYSYIFLDSGRTTDIEYQCVANNTIKASDPCSIKIPGSKLPWYLSKENLTVLIASIITLIICFLIVCIVIIVLCRKKRQNTKCNNPLEMEEREKPDGQSPDSTTQSKWPLKPGVLVHVSKMHNVNISQLGDSSPFRTTSVSNTLSKYKRNKSKVYARLQRLKDLLGFNGRDRIPSGIIEGASGVVTYKKIKPTTPGADSNTGSRKRKKPGYAPNPSSVGDKTRLGAAPPVGGSADPVANDHDKGFYENLPFHGMQNPPNKPISVIAPFTQETTRNSDPSAKSLSPIAPCHKIIQRHQSFHGFQNGQSQTGFPRFDFNRSNPYLSHAANLQNKNTQFTNMSNQQVRQPFRFQSNFQPILNFNPFLLPNPFSIPPQTNKQTRVAGRREMDIRRTASGINISENTKSKDGPKTQPSNTNCDDAKRFGSLEIKKHKCYSPTFYSMRCKKHAKKRPVVYALPKKVFGDLKPAENKPEKPQYQDLTDSIQIFEQNSETGENQTLPTPAPRCRKHRRKDNAYANVSQQIQNATNSPNPDVSNSSNDGSENIESEISVIEAQVHTSIETKPNTKLPPKLVGVSPKLNVSLDSAGIIKVEAMKALKSSPMLKVSPNFVKPKTQSPKGALSLQIQAKRKNSTDNLSQTDDGSSKENLPLIPQMPLLSPQSDKWSPNVASINQQNAFYTLTTPHYKHINVGLPPQYSATIPHQKHTKLIPRALFNEPLPKSKSFSSKSKHKKHFQIPLQKCHSFKFQTAESYFQPIRNIHEEDLMKNGYVSDYPEASSRTRHHKRDKPKQKSKGPLVVMRPSEYHGGLNFPESVQSSVQLQYPQPVLGRSSKKPNGVVYADLDMPKTNSKKSAHETGSSSQSKTLKSKPKTEYATLSFNDVGQEIDV